MTTRPLLIGLSALASGIGLVAQTGSQVFREDVAAVRVDVTGHSTRGAYLSQRSSP